MDTAHRDKPGMRRRLRAALLSALLALAVGACASAATSPGHPGPSAQIRYTPAAQSTSRLRFEFPDANSLAHPFYAAALTFAPGVSFSQALQMVTDLGLQPIPWCALIQATSSWQPLSEQAGYDQQNDFTHILQVASTPAAPPDWLERLNANRSVTTLYDGPGGCPFEPSSVTPLPSTGDGAFLSSDYLTYAGVFVQARFSVATNYTQALSAVANLGFRLANPCYEQALKKPPKPVWRTPGQEQSFAAAHTLVLATTGAYAGSGDDSGELRPVAGATAGDAWRDGTGAAPSARLRAVNAGEGQTSVGWRRWPGRPGWPRSSLAPPAHPPHLPR